VPAQQWADEAGGSEEAGRVMAPRKMSSRGPQDSLSSIAAKAAGLPAPEGNQPGGDSGECAGYHRGRRAGHVFTGVARELGRTTCRRAPCPAWGPGGPQALACPGGFTQGMRPPGTPRTQGRRHGIGSRATRAATREGQGVVFAVSSPAEGGAPCPTGPTGGKAPPGITLCWADLWESLRAHEPYP
jgi:hypothetical protein